uniref:Methenyltetrahydrofolate synthetase domain containing n=1 Tax=Molossus molossus TaxID=27622 RepID=A0A7J8C9G9_MOLMO|nr:methenyltetrahydrofolate synthetase domain containing [Molossus molossus]
MEARAGISKQDIREQIWDYMESQNLADFPRPVHHRIPNFKGSYLACQGIKDLDIFARTQEVKVDPDKPLEGVRLLALQSQKTLLVPTPRLRTGLFNKITPPPGASKDVLRKCATSQISCEMMGRIPILRSLRSREKQAGKDVTLQDEHQHLPEPHSQHTAPPGTVRRPRDPPPQESGPVQAGDVPSNTVYVGNLPRDTRVSELKRALRGRGAAPLRLTWQGLQHRAFLHYQDPAAAQQAVSCLQGLHLGANTLSVALARQQTASDLVGSCAREPHPDHCPTI